MTDNEIIKAYGCCNLNHDECGGCDNCPCKTEGKCSVRLGFDLEREVFNLLNRQKAEIERLKGLSKHHRILITELNNGIADAKAEAIKEFAEMVKKYQVMLFNEIYSNKGFSNAIDNLVKEMVGDTE